VSDRVDRELERRREKGDVPEKAREREGDWWRG
jgi:hypothetical protein